MKNLLIILCFALNTNYSFSDTIATNGKLKELENKVNQVEANQINYRIEKDLLKEAYSNNYEKINFFITLILGAVGILGYLGLRDITSIKKEYELELTKLRSIKVEFDTKSKELDSDKKKFDEDLKSIIKENEEQSRKIKFIELKDKVRTLLKDNSLAGALEFANAALLIINNDDELLNQKGIILCRLNQMKEAVDLFKLALQQIPPTHSTILNAAECFYFAKEIEAAKELIERHKPIFEKKENIKVLELFKIIELYFSENKEELLAIAKRSVDIDNLKVKSKHYIGWNLQEAQHFIHYQEESELKTILKNLFWFYDAQISGETLLTRLNIALPSEYTDFEEFGKEENPI
jgi:tetratricopeptide (TPR) repeat protein